MAYEGATVTVGMAVYIDLPSGIRRLSDSGVFNFGGDLFESNGQGLGSIKSFELPTYGQSDTAPSAQISLAVSDNNSILLLAAPENQERDVFVWSVEIDAASGVVVNSTVVFAGIFDRAVHTTEGGKDTVNVFCVDDSEKFFEPNDGSKLSHARHQELWPGETGLSQATGVKLRTAWGIERPRRASAYPGTTPGTPRPNERFPTTLI